MTACFADVEEGEKVSCLAGGGQHGGSTALQLRNFGSYIIAGGVGQTGVKIARSL